MTGVPDRPPDPGQVADLATIIAGVAGEDADWAAGMTAASSLHDDLQLESVEVVALAVALRDRYGPAVDLHSYLAGLDLDRLIDLTVGDLAAYLAARRPEES